MIYKISVFSFIAILIISSIAIRNYDKHKKPWLYDHPMMRCALDYAYAMRTTNKNKVAVPFEDKEKFYYYYGVTLHHAVIYDTPNIANYYWVNGDINYGAVTMIRDNRNQWHCIDRLPPEPDNPLWLFSQNHLQKYKTKDGWVEYSVPFPKVWVYNGKEIHAKDYDEIKRLTNDYITKK